MSFKIPRSASIFRAGVAFVFLCAGCVLGVAKPSGEIKGTAKKPDGSAAAKVAVTVINQVTAQSRTVYTTKDGTYSIRVPPGAYHVKVQTDDGARFNRENIIVQEGADVVTLDIKLALSKAQLLPGAQAEEVPGAGEPLGSTGAGSIESEPQTEPDRASVRDRWRVAFPEYDRYGDKGARGRDIPFKGGHWYDPYDQNVLKGDYPVFGQKVFLILSAVDTFVTELNRTPKPSDVSSARPGSASFFGRPEVLALNHILEFSFEMFHGDSTFTPRDWAIKITPTFSLPNYVNAREQGVINIDPRRGTDRTDFHFSFEDAFVEKKIENTDSNFDFISVRVGIQPFVSDFRGFIFSDSNLGARVFGAFDNNKVQFNLAYFSQLDKDTNSGLNTFDRRHQNVYIANIFKQDFIRHGYTIEGSFHFNDDRPNIKYDNNGFLVRPALIGDARTHAIEVGYLGITGDGHLGNGKLGRFNLSNAYYLALGKDTHNPIAGHSQRIKGQMGALELTLDKDYYRLRSSFFYASGTKNPTGHTATGFDAIFDDPNFVGGEFSFFNREQIRLTQTGVTLVEPNSILPSLRSSKIQGQANFNNPGIFIYNVGTDVDLTQRLKAIFNVNYLRFDRTDVLEYVLFQPRIRHEIGYDYSLGIEFRPLLINNITFTFGGSLLQPGKGFRDIYTDVTRNCPANVAEYCTSDGFNIDPRKPLFSLFAQMKFIF